MGVLITLETVCVCVDNIGDHVGVLTLETVWVCC